MRGDASRRRVVRREDGQAMIEFVLILPVLLAITFAVIEFGKAINYWIDLTHLANEGARYASVNRWPTCPADDTSACSPTLKAYLAERANTGELREGGTSNVGPDLESGVTICFPEDDTPQVGEAVRVRVGTTYTFALVDGLLGAVGLGDAAEIDLAASATMRLERTPSANRVLAEDSAC